MPNESVDSTVAYLDYNATAPARPEATAAVLAALNSVGNASSTHAPGRDAGHRVETARRQLAELLNCSPGELVFTSGATEANNLALRASFAPRTVLVTSPLEHPAVLEAAKALTADAADSLVLLPVDGNGRVDQGALARTLDAGNVSVVSLMAANNETGVLTDLAPVVQAAHDAGALVHTDATQLIGRLPIDLADLDVDLLSLSAHKFGGPQGVGALFMRRGTAVPYRPLVFGGGQERGWRAGTLNVPGIAGAGAAAQAAALALHTERARIGQLRDDLEAALVEQIGDCWLNGAREQRLPGVSSITFLGAPADAVLASMPEIAASEGSACSSGAPSPSHVLMAMGLSREDADCTVRFSLGFGTTARDVDQAVVSTIRAVQQVRSAMQPST